MTLKSAMTSDISAFVNTDEFGVEVVIGAETVNAVVDFGNFNPGEGYGPDSRMAVVYVSVSDLSNPPEYRTAVTIGSDTWYVYRDMDSPVYAVEEGMYVFRVTTDERMRY